MNNLLLLSLLNERELYGYDIKRILREKYSHFTRVSFSTIYYTLDRLTEEGFITKREEKVGNRPPRSIYQITPAGRKEFRKKLLRVIQKESKKIDLMDPFNLPFSQMGCLPEEILPDYEKNRILEKRKHMVTEVITELEGFRSELRQQPEEKRDPECDLFTYMLIRRGILHMEAEFRWLNEVLKEFEENMNQNQN